MLKGRLARIGAGVAALAALALGGAALAGATRGGSDEAETQLTGRQAEQAKQAALRATGGGTVEGVERDSEHGATYEVEVRKLDGSTVDVRLDGSYAVVVVDSDGEPADGAGGGDAATP